METEKQQSFLACWESAGPPCGDDAMLALGLRCSPRNQIPLTSTLGLSNTV